MAIEDKTILTPQQVDGELENLEGWQRRDVVISRAFTFANFRDITSFLNHLVRTITEMNHHPDFTMDTGALEMNRVSLPAVVDAEFFRQVTGKLLRRILCVFPAHVVISVNVDGGQAEDLRDRNCRSV